MFKKVKRVSILFLLVAIVAGVSACSSNNSDNTSANDSNNGGSAASTTPGASPSDTGEEPLSKEPVTLTFWSALMSGNVPEGIQTDTVSQQIEKELGIKIDMDTHPTDEKLAALLATNDLRDIMVVDRKYVDQLKDNVLDLEPLIDKYGPDIKQNLSKELLQYSKDRIGQGTLKFLSLRYIPKPANPDPVWGGVYLRWDYYAELGYPEIKNYDDYLNVVAEMKKNHPTNEDGKPYIGFSPWFDWGPYIQINTMTGRTEGNENIGGMIAPLQINRTTFEMKNAYTEENSGFWQGVDFWYKAKQKGLLDPDALTQTYDQAVQKYNTGQVLASMINWMIGGSNAYLDSKGIKDKGWFGPVPMTGSKDYHYGPALYGGTDVFVISKESKHPDRAMQLINWLYSVHGAMTVTNGIEGVDWVKEDGKYKYTDTYMQNVKDPDAVNKYGYRKIANNLGLYFTGTIPGTDDPIDISASRDYMIAALADPKTTTDAINKQATQYYGVELVKDIVPKGTVYEEFRLAYLAGYLPTATPDEIKLLDQKIDNYLKQAVAKIIIAKNDEDFAAQKKEIIEQLEKLGIEQVYSYWHDTYTKAIEEYNADTQK